MRSISMHVVTVLVVLMATATLWALDQSVIEPATDTNGDIVVFELTIKDGPIVQLAARDRAMATIENEGLSYAISPQVSDTGLISFLVLEIKSLQNGQESLRQLGRVADIPIGSSGELEATPFVLRPIEVRSPKG